jgi:hypothetical protein
LQSLCAIRWNVDERCGWDDHVAGTLGRKFCCPGAAEAVENGEVDIIKMRRSMNGSLILRNPNHALCCQPARRNGE